jgi:KDO2-lipid IV(A) lauroyltransferase
MAIPIIRSRLTMTISHGLEFAGVRILTRAVQILPGRLADILAAGLGRLAWLILTSRRRIAINNLKRAFKEEKSETEIHRIARSVFVNVARTSVEFARLPILKPDKISGMVTSEGKENLDRVLKEGKGSMLITGHFGSWELLGGWVAACGYPLDMLVGEQHNRRVDNLLVSFRKSLGVGIIPVGVAARHVIKSLRSNRMVAVVSDQHAASGSTVVKFFGRPAATPKGPAAFAVKVGCPILIGVLVREGYNRHHALILPPIYPPRSGDDENDIFEMTQTYTSCLEEFIRQSPAQWMWTHRRWKID